jgi:hypothetical protein
MIGTSENFKEAVIMHTIETSLTVDKNREAVLHLPGHITPGQYQAVVVIEVKTADKPGPFKFSAYPVGLKSEDITFSRKELYDDKR